MLQVLLVCLSVLSAASTAFAKPLPVPGERLLIDPALPSTDFDFSGQVSLGNCSGSIIRTAHADTERAIVLTNGHCTSLIGNSDPNALIKNKPLRKTVRLYQDLTHTVQATTTRIVYAMMQPHDVALIELELTYAQLAAKGVRSRTLSALPVATGDRIVLPTGLYARATECDVVAVIPLLREDIWSNANTPKYRDCFAEHGTSGSPLVSATTGGVVGIHMTGNDNGEQCTMDNPCEVDATGAISVERGANYGDNLVSFLTCLDENGVLDLTVPSCVLP